MYLLGILVLLVITWFTTKYIKLWYARYIIWKDFASPPLDSYLTGHKISLRRAQANNTFMDLIMRWVQQYGGVILIWRDYKPVFFITCPVILEQLWSNVTDFKKLNRLPNRLLYNELITGQRSFLTSSGGLIWAMKRKMLSGFFTKANQKIIFPNMLKLVQKSVNDMRGLNGGAEIYNMEEGFATIAENLLIVCGLDNLTDIFSTKPGYLAKNIIALLEVLPIALNGSKGKQYQYTPEVQKCLKFIRHIRHDIDISYKELLKVTQNKDEEYILKLGMLGTIIQANEQGSKVEESLTSLHLSEHDATDFINDIMTLILVADNISKVVTVLFAKVVREETIYNKLKDEIRNTEINNYDDLKQLKYTEMVILETMRWCPILQRGARNISFTSKAWKNGEIMLGDKVLPYHGKSIDFQWSQYVMHHQHTYWKQPDVFDPQRFVAGTSSFVRNTYIPFIGGPRACLGKHLAMSKMKVMIHTILRTFEMSKVPGEDMLELDRKYTIVKVRQGKNIMLKTRPLVTTST